MNKMSIGKTIDHLFGDPLRALQGTKRCNTPEKLYAYMKGKGYDALHFWIEARMWYVKDNMPADEWTPLAAVLARDVYGKKVQTDCEERCVVKKNVVNRLGWGIANNLCVYGLDAKGKPWGHAVCVAWDKKGLLVMDYTMHRFPVGPELPVVAKALWPSATKYCFRDDNGVATSDMVLLA